MWCGVCMLGCVCVVGCMCMAGCVCGGLYVWCGLCGSVYVVGCVCVWLGHERQLSLVLKVRG